MAQMTDADALDPIPNAIFFNWATIFVLAFGNLAALDFQVYFICACLCGYTSTVAACSIHLPRRARLPGMLHAHAHVHVWLCIYYGCMCYTSTSITPLRVYAYACMHMSYVAMHLPVAACAIHLHLSRRARPPCMYSSPMPNALYFQNLKSQGPITRSTNYYLQARVFAAKTPNTAVFGCIAGD
eukprot:scaffold54055_cov61-Phaeocystis_antarctica.AAC.2